MIPVTTTDTFSVWVPVGDGGFILSEDFIVSDINSPCLTEVEAHAGEAAFSIFPEPADEEILIESSFKENEKINIEISDCRGLKIYAEEIPAAGNRVKVPVADLPGGIYFIRVNGKAGKFVKI